MTQRNLLTLLIILAVTIISTILVLPTLGVNVMEIQMTEASTQENIDALKKRFPAPKYKFDV